MNTCKPPVRCAGCWHYFTPHDDPKATLILRYGKPPKNGKSVFLETEVEICPTCAEAAGNDPQIAEVIQENVMDAYADKLQDLFARGGAA